MADQLTAHFWFKLPEGYAGYWPAGFLPFFNEIIRLRHLRGANQGRLTLDEFNNFLRHTGTETVILPDRPDLRALGALLTSDFRKPPARGLGVQVWHVDPRR
jgi:hypothetical protein